MPECIQVAEHFFVESRLLALFASLSLFSWTSATNAAHIYHHSLSRLDPTQCSIARYKLRTEHVWDGYVIRSLLCDATDRAYVLTVPHTGDQKDRFLAAMEARNAHMRRSGQKEFTHWCTKCVRRYDDSEGGSTCEYLSVFANMILLIWQSQPMSMLS